MLVSTIHSSGTSVISAYSVTSVAATTLLVLVGSTTLWAVLMPWLMSGHRFFTALSALT